MSKNSTPNQGDIIWINFNPVKGHEQGGRRPALVISNNKFNRMCGGIVKLIPITSSTHEFPLDVELPEDLEIQGKLKIEHQTSLDVKSRGYEYACKVSEDFLDTIIQIVSITIEKS